MKAIRVAVVIVGAFISTARLCLGQQETASLKNEDVIQMVGGGLGDDAVIDLIHSSGTQFNLSPACPVCMPQSQLRRLRSQLTFNMAMSRD